MLDINKHVSSLAKLVSDLVGYRLSTLPDGQGGALPSVIENRSGNPKPSFPYCTVDHVGINKTGFGASASWLDENEDEVDEFDYIGRFAIQFSGGTDDDVLSICLECSSKFFTSKGKRAFNLYFPNEGLNSGILSVSEPIFTSFRLETEYEEAARMTVDLWMKSVIVDQTTEVIEQVSVDGELYEDYDQVDPPLDVNVIAP